MTERAKTSSPGWIKDARVVSGGEPEALRKIDPPGVRRLNHVHVLMYSHDTFGLGHLRRCRTIAHALVERFKGLNVLIVSGSPVAGAFEFRARVDFVKVPSVVKLPDGDYAALSRHVDLQETLELRASIIRRTAESFQPDIFIVDKEPLGLRGELKPTLNYLKTQKCQLVLGLREALDAPKLLEREWARQDMIRRIEHYYDDVWVYGPRDFWDPLTGLRGAEHLGARMAYTGYLRRRVPTQGADAPQAKPRPLLVTAGGGGDGAQLMRQVLAAHEHDASLKRPITMVLGPFMSPDERAEIRARARSHPSITLIDFNNRLEVMIKAAAGVVAMGGYNTFCEILSLDKRALIVPRTHPREEQLIRARRAAELGVIDMLLPDEAEDPAVMAAALHRLDTRPKPSEVAGEIELDGLDRIGDFVEATIIGRDLMPLRRHASGAPG